MNFGIGSTFSKVLGSGFSEYPDWLYKVYYNYSLLRKKFYIFRYNFRLLAEIGIFSNSSTKTYSKVDTSKEGITSTNRKYFYYFGMNVTNK